MYMQCSAICVQRHTDFGLPWSLIFITALARGVPTGHLQQYFLALTGWPMAAPVPFGCLPYPDDTVCASGWIPAAPS